MPYTVILVETQNPGTIGSVARAMKNFGLTDLILVNPCKITSMTRARSMHAWDVVQKAKIVDTFAEAIKPFDELMQPSSYTIAENWGFQINFMVPLDRQSLKQCRDMAKRQEEKMRLDYELVRALKCAELQQKGFTFHPNSEMKVLCQDIVPISALLPPKPKKKFGLF